MRIIQQIGLWKRVISQKWREVKGVEVFFRGVIKRDRKREIYKRV
jgi:hypothetical protein